MRVFISYSHEDESYKNELERHLANLRRSGKVTTWHDRRIKAGEEWDKLINEELEKSDLILLLISSDFIASDYCYDIEVAKAVEYHDKNEKIVVPVIIRFCDWSDTPFAKIQALPTDGLPIDSKKWNTDDEAYLNVINGIKKLLSLNNNQQEKSEDGTEKKEEGGNENRIGEKELKKTTENNSLNSNTKKIYAFAGILVVVLVILLWWINNNSRKAHDENADIRKQIERLQNQLNSEKHKANNANDTDPGSNGLKNYWRRGDTITIAFLGGTQDVQDFVKKTAMEWLASGDVDLYFKFVADPLISDIRISFTENDGSWSFTGTEAWGVNKSSPTMNLGYLKNLTNDIDKRQNVFRRRRCSEFSPLLVFRSPQTAVVGVRAAGIAAKQSPTTSRVLKLKSKYLFRRSWYSQSRI